MVDCRILHVEEGIVVVRSIDMMVEGIVRPRGRPVVVELVLPGAGDTAGCRVTSHGETRIPDPESPPLVSHRPGGIVPSVKFSRHRDAPRKSPNIVTKDH